MVLERLDAAARHPENQEPEKQAAIEQARNLLIEAGVKDPGTGRIVSVSVSEPQISKVSSGFCSKDVVGTTFFTSSGGGCG